MRCLARVEKRAANGLGTSGACFNWPRCPSPARATRLPQPRAASRQPPHKGHAQRPEPGGPNIARIPTHSLDVSASPSSRPPASCARAALSQNPRAAFELYPAFNSPLHQRVPTPLPWTRVRASLLASYQPHAGLATWACTDLSINYLCHTGMSDKLPTRRLAPPARLPACGPHSRPRRPRQHPVFCISICIAPRHATTLRRRCIPP